jgi:hypothetical protein
MCEVNFYKKVGKQIIYCKSNGFIELILMKRGILFNKTKEKRTFEE